MNIIIAPFSKKLPSGKRCAKDLPIYYWNQIIKMLKLDNHSLIQVGGKDDKQLLEDCRLGLNESELKKLIESCDFFITVDSYFQHLAWYYNKKGIVIFSKSDPKLFGHKENFNILKDESYLRKEQFAFWHDEPYDIDAFLEPEEIYEKIKEYSNSIKN